MVLKLERLLDVVNGPDERLDLAEAALLIAADEYPGVEASLYLARLRELGERISRRLTPDSAPGDVIFALNECLFQEEGFVGAERDYYDPQNSYLNRVLDRRRCRAIPLGVAIPEQPRAAWAALERDDDERPRPSPIRPRMRSGCTTRTRPSTSRASSIRPTAPMAPRVVRSP